MTAVFYLLIDYLPTLLAAASHTQISHFISFTFFPLEWALRLLVFIVSLQDWHMPTQTPPARLHSGPPTGVVISSACLQPIKWKPSCNLTLRLQDESSHEASLLPDGLTLSRMTSYIKESPQRMQSCWHKAASTGENWFIWCPIRTGEQDFTHRRRQEKYGSKKNKLIFTFNNVV